MNTDFLKERVKFLTEMLKITLGFFLLVSSGTVSLILRVEQQTRAKEAFCIFIGMILMVASGLLSRLVYRIITNYINVFNH